MLSCMRDSAHDKAHVYRVLYIALDIAAHEAQPDWDVLIAACLLHDIGRQEQFDNPALCHAAVGAEKARRFLVENGFSAAFAARVAACVRAHRYRTSSPPVEIEEKILFDSDKIDVTGALGIARTIFYGGQMGGPLYTLDENGAVCDGSGLGALSFLREYKFKLEGLYAHFYTQRGREIALERQAAAVSFYENILSETRASHEGGTARLAARLE